MNGGDRGGKAVCTGQTKEHVAEGTDKTGKHKTGVPPHQSPTPTDRNRFVFFFFLRKEWLTYVGARRADSPAPFVFFGFNPLCQLCFCFLCLCY